MKLILETPKQSLNKAYLKQRPLRKEIEIFKANLTILLSKINEIEREENQKNHIRDFLLDTYYKDSNEVNTKGDIDLVIHTGKTSKEKVGVIIEAKRPSNKVEMITKDKITTKAFFELVLYFMRERVDEGNEYVRNLIITNINQWYIFDASYFEKLFFRNKNFLKLYEDWKNGILIYNDTQMFYNDVVKKYITVIKEDLPCTYFNILDFKNALTHPNKENDKSLISLYKILSPGHLLRTKFSDDSNSLNEKFYKELLYLIGLEDVVEGNSHVIKRNKVKESGSLIENTISILETENSLNKVSNIEVYGESEEERYFNIALELCITWINRILFLKLLEGQLLNYHNKNSDYKFLNFELIKDFNSLYTLFHQVLAKNYTERLPHIRIKYLHVPYLNSSLFEISALEIETIRISQLDDSVFLNLMPNSVISNPKYKNKKIVTLEYILNFLDAYDFSTEGSEDIQEENKPLINASVLGKIFEKINGYKDGSYFTPSYITMYMCRETVRKAVINKFIQKYNWKIEKFEDIKNYLVDRRTSKDIYEQNDIINSIKICDPAVGSGHFLVSALNEIIAIKSELGILIDEKGNRFSEIEVSIDNDELIIADSEYNFFKYEIVSGKPRTKEIQRLQKTLFYEKQNLIENSLFGVDINPNSVKICRLRLWIELLKNAYYKEETNFFELETLPNIDINIKCGNSLLSQFEVNEDFKPISKNVKTTIAEYKKYVNAYKTEKNRDVKNDLLQFMNSIKDNFKTELEKSIPKYGIIKKYEADLYNLDSEPKLFEHTEKQIADAEKKRNKIKMHIEHEKMEIENLKHFYKSSFEWRFEFPEILDENGDYVGFDVVIANPPYIYNRDLPLSDRNYYNKKFNSSDDLYGYFVYEAIKLLSSDGFISFITPNTYFTLSTKEKLRETFLKFSELSMLYSGYVFTDAYVETQLFMFRKKLKSEFENIIFIKDPKDYLNYNPSKASYALFENNLLHRFFWPTEINIRLHEKINIPIYNQIMKFKNKLFTKEMQSDDLYNDYMKTLKENSLTLLGLICEGEQGLVTGNNSKYLASIVHNKSEELELANNFISRLNQISEKNYDIKDFLKNKEHFYEIAEELKIRKKKPSIFGKFFNYKTVYPNEIKFFSELTEQEKSEGGAENLWVYYNRGNYDGLRWNVPYQECILWSKEIVEELKNGVKTNSRWQGVKYFDSTGFGWVDYFTDKIKSFYIDRGVYSKNIVKLHSTHIVSDKVIVCILNSNFMSYYIKNFITATHTLQINDGKLIPIKIPSKIKMEKFELLFDMMLEDIKATDVIESEIDKLVYELYEISAAEIKLIEGK